jgi:hypothetical protein
MRYAASRPVRAVPAILGLAALVLAAATVPGAGASPAETRDALAARGQQQPPPPEKCCFTNPAYSGTCEVVPGKDETCSSILDYLNNPMSQGKGYCSNTTIRSGWKSAACSTQ